MFGQWSARGRQARGCTWQRVNRAKAFKTGDSNLTKEWNRVCLDPATCVMKTGGAPGRGSTVLRHSKQVISTLQKSGSVYALTVQADQLVSARRLLLDQLLASGDFSDA